MKIRGKNYNLLSLWCLAVTVFLFSGVSRAEAPVISAKLVSPTIVMGDKTTLEVQVVADRGAKGRFPIFDDAQNGGYVTLCGDSVELGADFKSSSIDLGSGREQTDFQIPVQAFDSGTYKLPEIAYVIGKDTLRVPGMELEVTPVQVQATDELSDFTGVLPAGEGSFYDRLPLFLLEWWWVFLIVILALAAFALFLMKYKLVRLKQAAKPLPPYEQAVVSLNDLKAQDLWQKGETKEYYTRLVDILRRYISGRFEIHAMEMTTGQILDSVKRHSRIKPYLKQFESVLNVADFAKFANMLASAEENEEAFDKVKKFVDDTRPTVEEAKIEAEKVKKSEPAVKKSRWEKRNTKSRKKGKEGKQ